MEQELETRAQRRAQEIALSAASHLPLSNFSSSWPVQGVPSEALLNRAEADPQPKTSPERPPGTVQMGVPRGSQTPPAGGPPEARPPLGSEV